MIWNYLRGNTGRGLKASPFKAPPKAWGLVPIFVLISLVVGFGAGIFEPKTLASDIAFFLPLTLFVFPALLEEVFFRGVLIPRDVLSKGKARATQAVLWSTLVFVIWHPINALAFNHSAIPLFLDPYFLILVTALGVTCGYGYVVSKSIWVPVIIHWASVTTWVFFLGGRNLLLDM